MRGCALPILQPGAPSLTKVIRRLAWVAPQPVIGQEGPALPRCRAGTITADGVPRAAPISLRPAAWSQPGSPRAPSFPRTPLSAPLGISLPSRPGGAPISPKSGGADPQFYHRLPGSPSSSGRAAEGGSGSKGGPHWGRFCRNPAVFLCMIPSCPTQSRSGKLVAKLKSDPHVLHLTHVFAASAPLAAERRQQV